MICDESESNPTNGHKPDALADRLFFNQNRGGRIGDGAGLNDQGNQRAGRHCHQGGGGIQADV